MSFKRYRIKDGVLRFEDGVHVFDDYLRVPRDVHALDFNQLLYITKPLRLEHTKIIFLDFKHLLMVKDVFLPKDTIVVESLYWSGKITNSSAASHSERMFKLRLEQGKKLVYLSGTVKDYLGLRETQSQIIYDMGFGVYSPGNHITFGDENAEIPGLVYNIDINAMELADVFVFDLNNLSPGTCAELGYVIGAGWHKTKELFYIMDKPTPNFFINGLISNMEKLDRLEHLQSVARIYK